MTTLFDGVHGRLRGRLETVFTLLSPLSHIGRSIGPDSFLATETILDANKRKTEVFVYSGNAWRGALRDVSGVYMLEKLSPNALLQLPLDVFYMLFSGGSIGGDQSIDIDQARRIRRQIPPLSVFGCGAGNMMLPGKINVGRGYPVCRELAHDIPEYVPGNRELSWQQITTENSYSRKDDAKDDLLRVYLREPEQALPAAETPQIEGPVDEPEETPEEAPGLFGAEVEKDEEKGEYQQRADSKASKIKQQKPKADKKPQQMRYTLEVFCQGAVLWQETTFFRMTEIELGVLAAALYEWGANPVLGGQNRIGMGKVKADIYFEPYGGEKEHFVTVGGGKCLLGETAAAAKRTYDIFLERYSEYLENNREGLVKAITGTVAQKKVAS